jgi:hypothetical protein
MKRNFHSWLHSSGDFLVRVYQELLSPSVAPSTQTNPEANNRAGRWPDAQSRLQAGPLPTAASSKVGDADAKAPSP